MHEFSIVRSLLTQVEKEAAARGATAVRTLRVEIGELSGVSSDLFLYAFEALRSGTICARADLKLAAVPARWTCPECDDDLVPTGPLRCGQCGSPARLVGGAELLLSQIEVEIDKEMEAQDV